MLKQNYFKTMIEIKPDGSNGGSNGDGTNSNPNPNPDPQGNANPNGDVAPVVAFTYGENQSVSVGQTVEVDGKDYTIDATGNVIDPTTKAVILSKDAFVEHLTKSNAKPEDNGFVAIQKLVGVELTDETGKPIEFDNTPEGIAKYVDGVSKLTYNQARQEAIEELFESNPEFKDMLNHKQIYGNLDNYKAAIDYSKIDVNKASAEHLRNIFITAQTKQGLTTKDAEELWNLAVTNKSEKQFANVAIKYLDNINKQEQAQRDAIVKQKEAEYNQRITQTYGVTVDEEGNYKPLNIEGSFYDLLVAKGKVGNVQIPQAGITGSINGEKVNMSRKDLFEFFSIATESGMTRADLLLSEYVKNRDNYTTLVLSLLSKKGFTGLIENNTTHQKLSIKLGQAQTNTKPNDIKIKPIYGKQ